MIEHRIGNLFDAPVGSILAHACNGKGTWGGGIAAEFKKRRPAEYVIYHDRCAREKKTSNLVGQCIFAGDVACLITSDGFGARVDSPESILGATEAALGDLFYRAQVLSQEIHMPKINSGLFCVPWELTEAVIERVLAKYKNVKVVVWSLN